MTRLNLHLFNIIVILIINFIFTINSKPFTGIYFPDDPRLSKLRSDPVSVPKNWQIRFGSGRQSSNTFEDDSDADASESSESRFFEDSLLFPKTSEILLPSPSSGTKQHYGSVKKNQNAVTRTKLTSDENLEKNKEQQANKPSVSEEQLENFIKWITDSNIPTDEDMNQKKPIMEGIEVSTGGVFGEIESDKGQGGQSQEVTTENSDFSLIHPIKRINCPNGSFHVNGRCKQNNDFE